MAVIKISNWAKWDGINRSWSRKGLQPQQGLGIGLINLLEPLAAPCKFIAYSIYIEYQDWDSR